MSRSPRPQVYHGTHKTQTGGNLLASLMLAAAGLICLLISIGAVINANRNSAFLGYALISGVLALILLAVAILVSPKYRIEDYCTGCGNAISATTLECPHCHSEVIPPPLKWWQRTNVILGLILLLLVASLILSSLIIG